MNRMDDFVYPGRKAPERVVSLVPSLTESLFDLGFGWAVVGITEYCTEPAAKVEGLPRVGGPLDARLESILGLRPDLVIANYEENSKDLVEALRMQSILVWVTYPRTVGQSLELLEKMATIFRSQAALDQVRSLEMAVDWARSAASDQPALRYFCPIWQEDDASGGRCWMTFTGDTYLSDLLSLFGGQNVFGEWAAPADQDNPLPARYPRVSFDEIYQADPELILLPDEPFSFDESHRQEYLRLFAGTTAAKNGKIFLVDGRLIAWFGTHLAKAIEALPDLFNRISPNVT